ncbi:MAG: 4-carboxymuconolactone decarboxylase [Mycobacterium sp.]|jgi:4-carboxymuconolactone decarboxylase|nr:4-carboxymuconolactone decarboxylase [Mycobacterium sp.]
MTDNSDSGAFGRYQEVPVEHLAPEMKAAYDFTLGMRGHLPGPSKIWLANPKLLQTITPTGAYFQTESTLTKAEIEIATNLINGKWHAAYSNSEHEQIGQVAGGLAPHKGSGVDRRVTNVFRRPAPTGRL